MKTFFVTYNTGEFDSYVEHVYSFDAESKEDLYAEIYKAIESYCDYSWRFNAAKSEIIETYRPKNPKTAGQKQYLLYNKKLMELYDKYPGMCSLTVYGYQISLPNDLMDGSVEEACKSAALEIHSVEEYIQFCRPNKP
jgi:hypothetical protein